MNAFSVGSLIGAVFGLALVGALFAWIIRKLVSWRVPQSYAAGIVIAVLLASYIRSLDGWTFIDGLTVYGTGGVLAFFLLMVTLKEKPPQPLE